MAWINLDSPDTLNNLIADSASAPKIIFKHSTRCPVSAMALNRLQESAKKMDIFIIDVINNRDISNAVEQKLNIVHQSPQLLVLSEGTCKYHTSHMGISSSVIDKFFSPQ